MEDDEMTNQSNEIEHPLFVSVEGPIGVGKTTLAKLLAEKLNAHSLKEIIEENPYLKNFYEDIEEYAFQTEMFFLCNRIKQLEDAKKNYLDLGVPVVSDYSIIKNLVFSGLTLDLQQFQKYKQVYSILTDRLPQPDLIIYLYADVDVLMQRIALRDRPFERNMSRKYIEELSKEYAHYFSPKSLKHYFSNSIPQILSLNVNEKDFVNHPGDLDEVLTMIEEVTKNNKTPNRRMNYANQDADS